MYLSASINSVESQWFIRAMQIIVLGMETLMQVNCLFEMSLTPWEHLSKGRISRLKINVLVNWKLHVVPGKLLHWVWNHITTSQPQKIPYCSTWLSSCLLYVTVVVSCRFNSGWQNLKTIVWISSSMPLLKQRDKINLKCIFYVGYWGDLFLFGFSCIEKSFCFLNI